MKEGDRVQRKTHGPGGTVTHVQKDGRIAYVWFDGTKSAVRVEVRELKPERRPGEPKVR